MRKEDDVVWILEEPSDVVSTPETSLLVESIAVPYH